MTRIDFYFNVDSKSRIVYRICLKIIQNRTSVDILCPEQEISRSLDKFLWTASAIGFVPHAIRKAGQNRIAPVSIVSEIGAIENSSTLINMSRSAPPQFNQYDRLIEIVSADDEVDKSEARERHRFYKARGYALTHHDLSSSELRQN